MLNHTKIIFRSLIRNRSYTFLNLLGLTSGLLVFLLIVTYVDYEFSFDRYHKKKDRIFRVFKRDHGNFYQGTDQFAVTPAPLAKAIKSDFPEVIAATTVNADYNTVIRANEQVFLEPRVHSADDDLFEIFSLEVLAGSRGSLLSEPSSVVLSESVARKYFDRIDVIGETIRYRDEIELQVTGVIEDMPSSSHFQMNVIANFQGLMKAVDRRTNDWGNSSFHAFLLLEEGADAEVLEGKLPQIRAKYADDPIDEDGQMSTYYLQALEEIHFTKDVNFDLAPSADAKGLYLYLGIALLILFIASINYLNLATARAMSRMREVAIRKAIGAHRAALVGSFLRESMVFVGVSVVFATLGASLVLPYFSDFVGKELLLPISSVRFWVFVPLLVVVMTILAGLYPAIILSKFQVVRALKGKMVAGHGDWLRNALVIFQFTISCGLILGASVLNDQLQYIQNMDTGYTRDQIVVTHINDAKLRRKMGVLKEDLRKIPGVVAVTSSNSLPNNISSNSNVNWPGMPEEVEIPLYTNVFDYEYVDLFELELVAGRGFDRELDKDRGAVLLNESAVKALGWEEPLGHPIITWFGDTTRVVGILKDFHSHSVHLPIEPAQFFLQETRSTISIKMDGASWQSTLQDIEATYQSFGPLHPFDYNFFDDLFDRAYQSEMNTARLAEWFTGLAILIACLGLYGLTAHRVQHRTKEVGIRKVLGANVLRIVVLLTKDFGFLVGVSFLLAAPLAWYVMQGWLDDFAYHVEMNWISFALALLLMLVVAGATVGYRTVRAAIRNPVEALREE